MFINISYSLIIVLSVNKDISSQKYINKSAQPPITLQTLILNLKSSNFHNVSTIPAIIKKAPMIAASTNGLPA